MPIPINVNAFPITPKRYTATYRKSNCNFQILFSIDFKILCTGMLNTFIHNPINIFHTGACNSVYNTQKYTNNTRFVCVSFGFRYVSDTFPFQIHIIIEIHYLIMGHESVVELVY